MIFTGLKGKRGIQQITAISQERGFRLSWGRPARGIIFRM